MDSITVIIAEVDDFTYGYGWKPPKRSVTIELTDEQKAKIRLGKYEHITDVFLQKQEDQMDKFCVCGCRVEANTGGYDCPRCYRHYNVNGKLIGNNQMIQFFENAERQDIKTMHCEKQGEGK